MGAVTKEKEAAGEAAAPGVLGGTAIRPKTREGWGGIADFLYNKDQGTFCGRTCKSWGLITAFYLVYYTCLFSIWYGFFSVFMLTITDTKPTYVSGPHGIIKTGMAMVPAQHPDDIATSVLTLNGSFDGVQKDLDIKIKGDKGYASRIHKFMEAYTKENENATDCASDDAGQLDDKTKFCKFDVSDLGDCAIFPYGYAKNAEGKLNPCVYIKLNRVFDLVPEAITKADEFPETGEESVKAKLKDAGYPANKIYLDCKGEYPADTEALEGKLGAHPADMAIPLKHFPMTTKYYNQNPMVALQFNDPPVNRLIHVICKIYYKGAEHSKKYKKDLLTFQIFVEDKPVPEKKEL